ncbi:hypothetical protein [Lysinibacillus sp. G01H]|uniref:hypothetical protein n=1 Tax=Lysinibacillus sp. G01H TaxID=3026425 RepID=UPI00237E11C5|nr:hypothetical protein [Lysinibacillus sp. G01H]WDU77533.1 hypothetical protein PSR12_12590 [Lysinibacillus sp. G01H]
MRENYKVLMVPKEIYKYFIFAYKHLDTYDTHTIDFYLRTTWAEITLNDLKIMDKTIMEGKNNSSVLNSLMSSGLSIIVALAIGFIAAFITIIVTDKNIDKYSFLTFVAIFTVIFLIWIFTSFMHSLALNHKTNKLHTMIKVMIEIKKSKQNKLIKASTL